MLLKIIMSRVLIVNYYFHVVHVSQTCHFPGKYVISSKNDIFLKIRVFSEIIIFQEKDTFLRKNHFHEKHVFLRKPVFSWKLHVSQEMTLSWKIQVFQKSGFLARKCGFQKMRLFSENVTFPKNGQPPKHVFLKNYQFLKNEIRK